MHLAQPRLARTHAAIRRHPLATASMLLLLAGGAASTTPAQAQSSDLLLILANLTPYNVTLPAFLNATCSSSVCRLPFPAIPAGKRLLVTGVSLNTYNSVSNDLSAVLTNAIADYSNPNYHQINLPGGLVAKTTTSGFGYTLTWSGVTSFYIDSGYTPTFVYNGSVLTNEYAGQGTITGFLVPQLP